MASVDGLISGLNTTQIVSQLMQLERQPQVRLQQRQSTVEAAIGALRSLNTKFLAITSATQKLGAASTGTTPSDWQLTTATSSDTTRVSAQASTGAPAGSVTLTVNKLATAASSLSTGSTTTPGAAGLLPANSSIWLSKGTGAAVEVQVGDGSLNSIVSAINKSGSGITASTVQLASGEYSLQLASATTGAGAIKVETAAGSGVDPFAGTALGGIAQVSAGQDAELTLLGNTVTRSSNTVSDLLQGVTLTLTKADPAVAVTIDVKSDTEGIASRVSGLVDALNAAMSDIKAVTGYNVETGNKGKLYGDAGVRGLRDRLAGAIVGNGTTSAGMVGVSMTRDGTVAFDKTKFLEALAKDPAAVENALGADGLAGRVHAVADAASRSKTAAAGPGLIASAITSRESQVSSLKTSIKSWDQRLELRESTLRGQYAALEKALGAAQSQGQWLAGQIASLPSWGS